MPHLVRNLVVVGVAGAAVLAISLTAVLGSASNGGPDTGDRKSDGIAATGARVIATMATTLAKATVAAKSSARSCGDSKSATTSVAAAANAGSGAGESCDETSCAHAEHAATARMCEAAHEAGATRTAVVGGPHLTGRFDAGMSSGCQGACAAKSGYDVTSVIHQPAAQPGQLTQCPVSGVVFTVKKNNPRLAFAGSDYATCCGSCVARGKADPARYVRS